MACVKRETVAEDGSSRPKEEASPATEQIALQTERYDLLQIRRSEGGGQCVSAVGVRGRRKVNVAVGMCGCMHAGVWVAACLAPHLSLPTAAHTAHSLSPVHSHTAHLQQHTTPSSAHHSCSCYSNSQHMWHH